MGKKSEADFPNENQPEPLLVLLRLPDLKGSLKKKNK